VRGDLVEEAATRADKSKRDVTRPEAEVRISRNQRQDIDTAATPCLRQHDGAALNASREPHRCPPKQRRVLSHLLSREVRHPGTSPRLRHVSPRSAPSRSQYRRGSHSASYRPQQRVRAPGCRQCRPYKSRGRLRSSPWRSQTTSTSTKTRS
jgi:hypothetical protein